MEKSLEQRARNLYVISGVIIVYLLAGADLNNLTLLGFRVPAKYPIVFSIASVLALLWFGWRYRLIWKKQKIGKAFRDNHLRALHQTLPFRFLVKTSLPHATILASHFGYDVNDPAVRDPLPKGSMLMLLYPRQFLREALAGDPAVARQMAEDYWSKPDANNWSSLLVAAVVGDRERANEFAARIDAYPGSAVVFGGTVSYCFCGAPFDLEATPNYKAHIEEAGFPWPPPKRIDYPTKTW